MVRAKSALIYYYFDFTDGSKQDVTHFMSSILADLCAQTKDLPVSADLLYQKCNHGHREPLLSDLLSTFLDIIPYFNSVYVVIDALDECPVTNEERQDLLKVIKAIHDESSEYLHMLVTSRQLSDIEAVIAPITSASPIQINSALVDNDIKAYIQSSVQAIRHTKPWWHDQLCKEVEETLLQRANGM